MAMLGQTITVVNKSGKVVSTSKHLVNVFKEAKSAYRERKAEIQASRDVGLERQQSKQKTPRTSHPRSPWGSPPSPRSPRDSPPSPGSPLSRTESAASSHRGTKRDGHDRRRREHRHERGASDSTRGGSRRQPLERGYTDSFYANDRPRQRSHPTPSSPLKFMEEAEKETQGKELVRRRSFDDVESRTSRRSSLAPRRTHSDIDMDLAYGELPPPLPARSSDDQNELKFKVTSLQRMLEEVNCLQHSAQATIKSLENNPDAMAAVALTMAEISGLVSKAGPGALMALKGAFPAVVALLASPEFLIAAGVGVGVTVIALGGYKIVKRIKAKKQSPKDDPQGSTEELEEIQSDINLDRIENWRRGIADVETQSIGTSVEGEFITPGAAKQLKERGELPASSSKKPKSTKESKHKTRALEKEEKKTKEKKEKKDKQDRKDREERERKAEKQDKHDRKEREERERKEKKKDKELEKLREKKDARLTLMLKDGQQSIEAGEATKPES